jgi:asparagine N-glycosylation enzyme membrane subunit Stt3
MSNLKWVSVGFFYIVYLPAHAYCFFCSAFSRCGVSGDIGGLSILLKCYFSVAFAFFLITSIKYRLSVYKIMNVATLVFIVSLFMVVLSVSIALQERLY